MRNRIFTRFFVFSVLTLAGFTASADFKTVYGTNAVLKDVQRDTEFKILFDQEINADGVREGFTELLQSYRYSATDIETMRWDGEYLVRMTLDGRNPNIYDDGVFVRIKVLVRYDARLNDFEIRSREIKILQN